MMMHCRRLAWVSFWGQLSLAIVSAIVLFFTMSATNWVRLLLSDGIMHTESSTALHNCPLF